MVFQKSIPLLCANDTKEKIHEGGHGPVFVGEHPMGMFPDESHMLCKFLPLPSCMPNLDLVEEKTMK